MKAALYKGNVADFVKRIDSDNERSKRPVTLVGVNGDYNLVTAVAQALTEHGWRFNVDMPYQDQRFHYAQTAYTTSEHGHTVLVVPNQEQPSLAGHTVYLLHKRDQAPDSVDQIINRSDPALESITAYGIPAKVKILVM